MSTKLRSGVALGFLSIASLACTGDDGGGGGGNPTPTPDLDISITEYFSISGDENVLYGECAGFTITDTGANFDEDTELFMIDPSLPVDPQDETAQDFTIALTAPNFLFASDDGTKLTLGGDPDSEDYPCISLPLDADGFWVAEAGIRVVTSNNQTGILESVLLAMPPPYSTLAYPGATAGSLEQTASFDAYDLTSVASTYNFVIATSANPVLQPVTAVYLDDFSASFFGYDITLFPSPDVLAHRYTIRDATLGGGVGFDYSLVLGTTGTLTLDPAPADDCGAAAQGITTGRTVQYVAIPTGGGDYDPAGALGCADRFSDGTAGVNAPGEDYVYQVVIPNGQTLRVGAGGPTTDVSMMLLTLPNCVATPTTCKAAADIYGYLDGDPAGSPGTDSLLYRNTTGSTETLYLVIDSFTTTDVGNVAVVIDIH